MQMTMEHIFGKEQPKSKVAIDETKTKMISGRICKVYASGLYDNEREGATYKKNKY